MKEPATAGVLQDPKGIVQHPHEIVGLAFLAVTSLQATPLVQHTPEFPNAQHPVNSAQADTSPSAGKQHPAQSYTASASVHLSNSPLWVLPMALLQHVALPHAAEHLKPSAEQCRALMTSAMTRDSSTVCFNMQGTPCLRVNSSCLSILLHDYAVLLPAWHIWSPTASRRTCC